MIREGISGGVGRVADMVRRWIPHMRSLMTREEMDLVPHLRGNAALHSAIQSFIMARIAARDALAVPADPIACKSVMERNNELRWLSSRLEYIFRSPVVDRMGSDNGEQPAA